MSSPPPPPERQGHATLDLASRALKGRKIEQLLELAPAPRPRRLLEVGTGSGGIAHYFAHHPRLAFAVDAVDVEDQRQARDGYGFQVVTGTALPFADAVFDVAISNHVIEHVGDADAQRHHLAELYRVLRPGAVAYLAVPNRWMLIEPHYRLAFLSWLPRGWRTPYLRLRGRGRVYDCEPFTRAGLEQMLAESRFSFRNIGTRALRALLAIERPGSRIGRLAARVPDRWLETGRDALPTLIYRLDKPPVSGGPAGG